VNLANRKPDSAALCISPLQELHKASGPKVTDLRPQQPEEIKVVVTLTSNPLLFMLLHPLNRQRPPKLPDAISLSLRPGRLTFPLLTVRLLMLAQAALLVLLPAAARAGGVATHLRHLRLLPQGSPGIGRDGHTLDHSTSFYVPSPIQ